MATKLVRRRTGHSPRVAKSANPLRHGIKVITLQDNSRCAISALDLFDVRDRRDPLGEAAKLAHQLISNNRTVLTSTQIEVESEFDGRDVLLNVVSENTIGAAPLISPTTAKPQYGIIVTPRFSWSGLGAMLAEMGWLIAPQPLKLDPFPGSEANIPRWVLSSMILQRLKELLRTLSLTFNVVTQIRSAPRGQVRWGEYATRSIASGRFLSVPCSFPELNQDPQLLGTIRFCLERIIESLQSQVAHGGFVHRMIEDAQLLWTRVNHVSIFIPSPNSMALWKRGALKTKLYLEGLEALQWTLEERGLAGGGKLEGIPWRMEMDLFFEAWVETVFRKIARTTAGTLKSGRLKQTVHPISWDLPYMGSQKSLIPDLLLDWGSTTMILDAKYKRHFGELQGSDWNAIQADWKEQHRNDLMQVLAYANLTESRKIISCLVYPCDPDTWQYLNHTGRLFQKAEITVGERALSLWMTAVPMKAAIDEVAAPIVEQLIPFLRAAE